MPKIVPSDIDLIRFITFVLANPTHIALPIRYDVLDAQVPIVVTNMFGPDAISFIAGTKHCGALIVRNIALHVRFGRNVSTAI